jgi:hypothetical protein
VPVVLPVNRSEAAKAVMTWVMPAVTVLLGSVVV